MKESSGKTKKLSKGVRRARSMRNVVMMVLVCALMLSAATYAWFTLSDTARITNLTMTVGEETSLLIAEDKQRNQTSGLAGEYKGALAFGSDGTPVYELTGTLLPASLESADGKIKKPEYDAEGQVLAALVALTDDEIMIDGVADADYYYYKTTFYLKNGGNEPTIQVQLKEPTTKIDGNSAGTKEFADGTYMVNSANEIGASAIRIRLTDDKNNVIIYQPLADTTNEATSEEAVDLGASTRTVAVATDVQNCNGAFTATNRGTLTVSNAGTRVTMEIWLEGTDDLCHNEVMADVIKGQLAFEIKDTATTP